MNEFTKVVEATRNDGSKAFFLLVILKNGDVGVLNMSGEKAGSMTSIVNRSYVRVMDTLRALYKEVRYISSDYGKY